MRDALQFRRDVVPGVILTLSVVFATPAFPADAVVIAEGGKAKLPLVIATSAGEKTRIAAEELRGYLQRISGAKFALRTVSRPAGKKASGRSPSGAARKGASNPPPAITAHQRAIFVGTQDEFPLAGFEKQLALRNTFDGVEAFVIVPRGGSLYLVGATDAGVSHAVFRFLERLGCRWYFPAKAWEVIPRRNKVTVDFEEASRPAILARRIWWGYGFFDRAQRRCQQDYEAWARHNRMGGSFRPYTGHAWQAIIRENQALFDAHPEYLALVKGKRRGPQMCISNPAVRKIALQWALKKLARQPELDMVSLETSDGSHHCECAACRKLGSISDRVFGLANEVAREVSRKYPGKMVGMLAYNDHCEPPSFSLEPNVYVQSTAGFVRGRYTFDELMHLWPKKAKRFGFYEYLSVWPWEFDQLPGQRGNDPGYIAQRFRQYHRLGATSITCESSNNWGLNGRGYYVANKLMWNPGEKVSALLSDFYEKAFGPAAGPMRRYYERFDKGRQPLMSEHLLALGFRDIEEATRLAAARPDVLRRLDHLKQYLHYVRLRWELDHLPRSAVQKRKRLTLAALRWCYRTRYSYMNHWAAMWQSWTRQAAREFNEPAWSFRSREPHPWQTDRPVSPEETEQVFRQDLQRFQPQPIEEVRFSRKLVGAGLKNPASRQVRPQPLSHVFQGGMRYVALSRRGEPLKFTITTGIIRHYRDRAAAKWTVTTAEGKQIAEGKLPQDGKAHAIEVAVPRAGLYRVECNDHGAGWGISTAADVPFALVLERGKIIRHLGQFRQPVFFFVPRGTRRLQFFWEGGQLKPRLHGPDGKQLAEIEENGRFVTVPVPPGTDGRAWFFTRFAPRRLWFANAPNYLAASPASLIVPREVQPPGTPGKR